MTTLPHSSSSLSPLRSQSFAKDDKGEGAGGTGTSHVVVTSSFAIASSVAIASVSTMQTTFGPSHGRPPHKKIPLHTLAAVREGNEGGPGKSRLLFLLEMNSGIGEARFDHHIR
jgi:hypothetical protein